MDVVVKIGLMFFWLILILELSILWDDVRGTRKVLAGIVGALLILIFIGFILSLVGIFELFSLTVSLLFIDCIIGTFLFVKNRMNLKFIKDIRMNPLVLIFLFTAMQLLWCFPSMNIHGGRDDGVYFMQGVHIAKTGMFEYEEDWYIDENYEEIDNWYTLGYLGLYSKYNYGTSESYGTYEFQFMPLFPVALAIGYIMGGIPLLIRVNGLIGILSLCCIYCFIRDYIGNRYHALISCYCILLSPAFLWNTRASFSEILTQCLFFCCVYLFAKGWNKGKKGYAALSGIMIGLALLTRIDAFVFGFAILVMMILVCIFEKKKKKYMFTLMGTYVLCTLLVIAYGLSNNYSYLHDQWRSLKFMLVMHIIMFILIGVANFVFRNHSVGNFLQNNSIQNTLILLYWIVIVFLLVIRPRINDDSFAVRATNEFTWYTSVIALLCVPIGIKAILNRNRDNANRCMLFLLSAVGIFFLYLVRPSIAEDHMWASRRWVLLGIPFVMICFANMMDFYNFQFEEIVNIFILILVVGFLISQDAAFMTKSIWSGIDEQYQVLADRLDDDEIYYVSSSRLGTTLRFIFDKNVYYLDRTHLISQKYDENKIVEYLSEGGKCIYYIGAEEDFKDERLQISLISEYKIVGVDLERTKGSYPRRLEQITVFANVYKITVDD